jgi:hypothetical protein
MSEIGILGGLGLLLIVSALGLWIAATILAARKPTMSDERGEAAHRGEVSGGELQGSPAQLNRRDEAPRSD